MTLTHKLGPVPENHEAFLCELGCTFGIVADESCDCRRWIGMAPAGFTPEAVCDCCGDVALTPETVAAHDGEEIFCKACLDRGLLDV